MKLSELEEIINTLDWIPFDDDGSVDDDWQSKYHKLKEHHHNERQFFINKCRKLAKVLKSYKEWDE